MPMKFSLPKRKPKSPSSTPSGTSPRKAPGGALSVTGVGITALGAAILLLLVSPAALYWAATGAMQESDAREAQVAAEHFADRARVWAAQQGARVEALTQDAALAGLMQQTDARAAKEAELALLFPAAMRVRLLAPGIQEVDMETSPPISYAALDMLRQAETKEAPPPVEAHMFGTPQQHINLVRRILDPGGRRIVGLMMVSYAVPAVQQILAGPTVNGYVELQQRGGKGGVLVLASRGEQARKQGVPSAEVAVAGSRWMLVYWSGDTAAAATLQLLLVAAGAAVVAAVVLALLLLGSFRRISQALKADQVTLINVVKDMRDGRVKPAYTVRLKELQDAVGIMARTASAGVAAAAPAAASAAGSSVARAGAAMASPASRADSEPELLFEHDALDVANIGVTEVELDPAIFRAYDIRGVVSSSLTPDVVYEIGRSIGSEAYERGQQTVVVARDGRLSGPDLTDALVRGLVATGRDVKDIGMVPTPVLYFAAQYLDTSSGVMVTGSHNPPEYNGLKIVLAGETLAQSAIQGLYRRIREGELLSGEGTVEQIDVLPDYLERIKADVVLPRGLKVVVDCGNGVAGAAAPRLLTGLGCEVVELFCEVDGNFPNHHPDPSKTENLGALIQAVADHGADLGLAFDGDGDRVGVVASGGEIIWPDRLMMLYAMDVLNRNPGGQIIYDVKCSRNLDKIIRDFGGDPLMWQTGHSLIKAKMKETGALLAGEMSGHIFFKERWFGFDDGLYAAARLLEILANDHRTSSSVFAALPDSINTPELNVPMREGEPHPFMDRLLASAHFEGAHMHTIDGLRAEFADGWGLVRASNTTPVLVLRFEADDEEALRRIQEEFRRVMLQVEPDLTLPF